VDIPAGTNVLISRAPPGVLARVHVPASSALIFGDVNLTIAAVGFFVEGTLRAGSPTCRLHSRITIQLEGTRPASGARAEAWYKGLHVTGLLDLHGKRFRPTWTRLAARASTGDTILLLEHSVNWEAGQQIVVVTTALKDSRDWHQNEVRTIVQVLQAPAGSGAAAAVRLEVPLQYDHAATGSYQAEVALLSRYITVQGALDSEPTDVEPSTCSGPRIHGSTQRPCPNSYLTGYGGHVMIDGPSATGRISGIELFRMGQTNLIGRYSIHFHLLGNGGARSSVRDCSVHRSFYRGVAVHGTNQVVVTENVAYDVVGHCYYLEDGVEEENVFSYNLAAYVHFIGAPASGGSQNIDDVIQSTSLSQPADTAAAGFYITNGNNDLVGNTASGGWSGFVFPVLDRPIGTHRNTLLSPYTRPLSRFQGNTAHSTGFWWADAGAIYFGGKLFYSDVDPSLLVYRPGRNARTTCAVDFESQGRSYCREEDEAYMLLEDTKVFLSASAGVTSWGKRFEFVRIEAHDVGIAISVLGQAWIHRMLAVCRTGAEPLMTWDAPRSIGFEWYDTGQAHILTDVTFRNCGLSRDAFEGSALRRGCGNGQRGCDQFSSVWSFLTFSDQHVPEVMQATSGVTYESCGRRFRFSNFVTDYGKNMNNGLQSTQSERLQNWVDEDGSVSELGVRALLGSAAPDTHDWWKLDETCRRTDDDDVLWACPLRAGRHAASINLVWDEAAQLEEIGSSVCKNGVPSTPCVAVGGVRHWGRPNELPLTLNGEITGPISGFGWHLRWDAGSPRRLTISRLQVPYEGTLVLSIAYPAATSFAIRAVAPPWCTEWARQSCTWDFSQVASVAEVRDSAGDAYHFDGELLYVRLVQPSQGNTGTPQWEHLRYPTKGFTRQGIRLEQLSWDAYLEVRASCEPSTANAAFCAETPIEIVLPTTCGAGYTQTAYDQCCSSDGGADVGCLDPFGRASTPLDEVEPTHQWQVDGCQRGGEVIAPTCAFRTDVAATAAVRCCSLDGSSCRSVCASSSWGDPLTPITSLADPAAATFVEAEVECAVQGMRLCLVSELSANLCCNSGCGADSMPVWASDGCVPGVMLSPPPPPPPLQPPPPPPPSPPPPPPPSVSPVCLQALNAWTDLFTLVQPTYCGSAGDRCDISYVRQRWGDINLIRRCVSTATGGCGNDVAWHNCPMLPPAPPPPPSICLQVVHGALTHRNSCRGGGELCDTSYIRRRNNIKLAQRCVTDDSSGVCRSEPPWHDCPIPLPPPLPPILRESPPPLRPRPPPSSGQSVCPRVYNEWTDVLSLVPQRYCGSARDLCDVSYVRQRWGDINLIRRCVSTVIGGCGNDVTWHNCPLLPPLTPTEESPPPPLPPPTLPPPPPPMPLPSSLSICSLAYNVWTNLFDLVPERYCGRAGDLCNTSFTRQRWGDNKLIRRCILTAAGACANDVTWHACPVLPPQPTPASASSPPPPPPLPPPPSSSERQWQMDGCPSSGEAVATTCALRTDMAAAAAVRCCSLDGSSCRSVCASSSWGDPLTPITSLADPAAAKFVEAEVECARQDMRLCRVSELSANLCCGSGCGADSMPVWTLGGCNI